MSNIYTDNLMFNAQYYIDNNADLKAIEPPMTPEQAQEHYIMFGAEESATGDVRVGPNSWFDIQFYREANPDLEELADADLLFHFSTYGAAEGRSPNEVFSNGGQFISADLYLEYALANADLLNAFGIAADATRLNDEQFANVANQFFNFGVNEEREGGIASIEIIPPTLEEALAAYMPAKAAAEKAAADLAAAETAAADAEAALPDLENAALVAAAAVQKEAAAYLPENFSTLDAATQASSVATAQSAFNAIIDVAQVKANENPVSAQAAKKLDDAATVAEEAGKVVTTSAANLGLTGSTVDGTAVNAFAKANDNVAPAGVAVIAGNEASFTPGTGVTAPAIKPSVKITTTDTTPGIVDIAIDENGKAVATSSNFDMSKLVGLNDLVASVQTLYDAQVVATNAAKAQATATVDALKLLVGTDFYSVTALTGAALDPANKLTAEQIAKLELKADGSLVVKGEVTPVFLPAITAATGALDLTIAPLTATTVVAALDGAVGGPGPATGTAAAAYFTLKTAQKELADFNKVVATWEEAQAAVDAANDAIENAEANIEAATEAQAAAQAAQAEAAAAVEKAAGPDINFADEVNGVATGTEGNDLFVYAGEELTIEQFGVSGEDTLFVGEGYVLTQVSNAADIINKADADVLQIFVYQDGENAVLSVEKDAFSGSVAGSEDLTEITITGVTAADLELDAGFIA